LLNHCVFPEDNAKILHFDAQFKLYQGIQRYIHDGMTQPWNPQKNSKKETQIPGKPFICRLSGNLCTDYSRGFYRFYFI